MKKILYLPIETVARELDGNLFLVYESLKRGYSVAIGKKGEIREFARTIGSGVYMHKHWEQVFPYKFDSPERKKYVYVGFHPEGLLCVNPERFKKRITVKGESEKLDINFVYGETQKKLLLEENPLLKKIIVPVGHPRFDILFPKFQSLFDKKVNKIKSKFGNYILINTNFSRGNRSRHYKENSLEQLENRHIKRYGRPLSNKDRLFIINEINYKENMFCEYKKMLAIISIKFPNINFILRPHPSEDHLTWESAVKSLDNVEVVFEGNVANWVLGATAIIHSGCTTAIEAWTARKEVIRYNPIDKSSPYESLLPNQFGRFASSIDELEILIEELLKNYKSDNFNEQKHIIKPFLESIDGKLSAERIMDRIDEVCKGKKLMEVKNDAYVDRYFSFERKIKSIIKKFIIEVLQKRTITRLIIGDRKATVLTSKFQKFPGIRKKYIMRFLTQISKIREKDCATKSIEVKRLDTDSFFIEA